MYRKATLAVVPAVLLLSAAVPARGQTPYYVKPAGNDASNGLSWASAKATIQAAINVASPGDTVWVTNGTYTLTTALSLLKGLTLRSVNGAGVTIVDANASDASRRHIITINAVGAVVEGFTFKKGYAWQQNVPVGAWAAGVVISNGTLRGCVVRDSYMRYDAPGVGGLSVRGAALVENCRIVGNSTGRGGVGGVYNMAGRLRNCVISSNSCGNIGIAKTHERVAGGVVQEAGSMEFCTIAGNWSVPEFAAGLSLVGGAVSNCVIYYNHNPATPALDHRNTWNTYKTGGTLVYSCTVPGVPGTGNITGDPQFANRLAQDYHLLPGSPCIDRATNVTAATTDCDGNPRSWDGDRNGANEPDMGAYEAAPATGGVFRCGFLASSGEHVSTGVVVLTACLAGPTTNVQSYTWDLDNGRILQGGASLWRVTNGYGVGSFDIGLRVTNTLGQTAALSKPACLYTAARTLYVAPSGGNVFPYATWSQAATSIQRAIEAAVVTATDASRVVVSNGTYTVADYTPLVLHKACTLKSLNGRQVTWLTRSANKTLYFRVVELYLTNAVIEGFSITNGAFTQNGANWNDYGGGIYMTTGTVRDCLVTGCQAPVGGGIYMLGGLVDRCIVRGNKAMAGYQYLCGGGICMLGGTVRNCLVDRNWATATNTTTAWGHGAGVSMGAGTRLENCTVVENSISNTYVGYQYSGAGVYRDAASATVTNCIVYYNRKAGAPNNMTNKTGVTFGNVGYSCSPDLAQGANSNLTAAPMFANTNAADYSLQRTSPCVNSGRAMAWAPGTLDLAGRSRQSSRIDRGGYEYPLSAGACFMFR